MKNNFFIAAAVMISSAMAASCSGWTEPEALDYGAYGNPAGKSEQYLEALRSFKLIDHKVVILRMDGTSSQPVSRSQHIMAMPDSADFICVVVSDGLHSSVASEISSVREQKGTRCVSYVDFNSIQDIWTELEDSRPSDQPAGTAGDFAAFCLEETKSRLEYCDMYGFDGIMFSFQGNISSEMSAAGQSAFLDAIEEWRLTHQDALMFARGSLSNIAEDRRDILYDCDYTILVSTTEASAGQLNTFAGRYARTEGVPVDRIVIEVAVASEADPEPACATPQTAASWTMATAEDYAKCGICIGNAADDYFAGSTFRNIRSAITILNPEDSQDNDRI